MNFSLPGKAVTCIAVVAFALGMAGCSAQPVATVSDIIGASPSGSASAGELTTPSTVATPVTADQVSEKTHFGADDLIWDAAKETVVGLSDSGSKVSGENSSGVAVEGGAITISAAGTYRLSGSLSDGKIVVDTASEGLVRIILDGVQVSNSSGSAVQVDEANEVMLYLAKGANNSLSDATNYSDTASDAPDAAVYSNADLTIAGTGSLSVRGNYHDGLVSTGGLVLDAGTAGVTAVDDGIEGQDYVLLLGGTYTVTAAGDGIKSTSDVASGRGWLHQYAGVLSVSAGDDGIKAERQLTISGGTAHVLESSAGIEAATIDLTGGKISVVSSGDGINAAVGTTRDAHLRISGGALTVTAEGDGLDSKGDLTLSGGVTVVNSPTTNGNRAQNSNGEPTLTGGVLLAAGSDGTARGLSDSSTQSGVQAALGTTVRAGTTIQVVDSQGQVVATFVPTKDSTDVVYSSAEIIDGAEYSFYIGGTSDVAAGLGLGTLDGASVVATATAGEFGSGGTAPGN